MTRERRLLLVQWAVFVVAVGVLTWVSATFVSWDRLGNTFFRWELFKDQFPKILSEGLKNTVLYTIIAFSLGGVLGLIAALAKQSRVLPARWIATAYIDGLRSLPALMTILLIGYGIPIAFYDYNLPSFLRETRGPGLVALSLVAGAYLAETIRAGIEAVPRGQTEAARSLGMSTSRAMWTIVLPQAFRIIVPPMTNEFVLLLKDTSLIAFLSSTPGQRELTTFGRLVSNENANYTPLVTAAVVYVVVTVPLIRLVNYFERRRASLIR